MKTKKMKNSVFVIFCICFLSCEKQNNLKQNNWLLGNWKAPMNEGVFTEKWTDQDTLLIGKSELNQNGNVVFSEKVELKYIKDTLTYVVIFNENGKESKVNFKATTLKDSLLIFENPTNNFPKKIKYQLISKDKIKASIHGDNNQSETFDFNRN